MSEAEWGPIVAGKFRTGANMPVIALDIDGTLGDYHKHFLWFAEQWLGQPMPPADEVNPGMRLSTFMGVPHHVYRQCKLAYRQGGLKRFMPVYPFAAELTAHIRRHGAQVWLCTTRPYMRHDNIDPDTREWLRRNNIGYDGILFEGLVDEDEYYMGKYAELVRQVGIDRVVAAVDDLPDMINEAIDAGIKKVYLREQPYNGECMVHSGKFHSLRELAFQLEDDIEHWKVQHG